MSLLTVVVQALAIRVDVEVRHHAFFCLTTDHKPLVILGFGDHIGPGHPRNGIDRRRDTALAVREELGQIDRLVECILPKLCLGRHRP